MGSEAFDAIKHGAPIDRIRAGAPQVTELVIHEATAPDNHPLVDDKHDNYAIAEPNMGKTVGHIAVVGDPESTTQPEIQITGHPTLSHVNETVCAQILPTILEQSGFSGVNPPDDISIERPEL